MSECAWARTRVCGVCTRKAANLRPISDTVLQFIKDYHYGGYNRDEFPSVICVSCDAILRYTDNLEDGEIPTRRLPNVTDYENKRAPRVTRSYASSKCGCFWCKIDKMNGLEYKRHRESVRPVAKAQPKKRVVRCGECHSIIGRGLTHKCTKSARNENAKEMVREFSGEGQRRTTSKLLNEFCEEEGVDKRHGTLKLNSGNKTKIVNIGPQKAQPQIAVKDFIEFGNARNLSDEAVMDTATFVRRALGKNYVEPNLEKTLPTAKLELKDFFVLKIVDTLRKKKGKEDILTHPLVLVEDVEAFAARIMAERGLDPAETDVIMGIDDGGQMLKVDMVIFLAPSGAQGVTVSVCVSVCLWGTRLAKALNLYLSLSDLSEVSLSTLILLRRTDGA